MREVNTTKKKCVQECSEQHDDAHICVCFCSYLDDGRWWSDPVVAAGCMVLCLATCVLIIAELGVCGRQKELLQLRTDPNGTRESGEGGKSERGVLQITSF